jgi:hypothetical protein
MRKKSCGRHAELQHYFYNVASVVFFSGRKSLRWATGAGAVVGSLRSFVDNKPTLNYQGLQ